MARILVAEDEPDILSCLSRALTACGHDVATARHGGEAVALLNAADTDLVIADIVMPVMDGIALALHVKARAPGLPVILITGHADARARAEALGALADAVLAKPFALDDLARLVARILAAHPSRAA